MVTDTPLAVSDTQLEKLIEQRDRCDDLIARIRQSRGDSPKRKPGRPIEGDPDLTTAERESRRSSEWRAKKLRAANDVAQNEEYQHLVKHIDWDLRESCRFDLVKYAQTFHPSKFTLEFGPCHYELFEAASDTILGKSNDLSCYIYPRGTGKSTCLRVACEWAAMYQHAHFTALITADAKSFKRAMRQIKASLEVRDTLIYKTFPEVCVPYAMLGRVTQNARYQHYDGTPTGLRIEAEEIVFATTPHSKEYGTAGGIFAGGGITSALRGMVVTDPITGRNYRPNLALLDDVQTRKSAKSGPQRQERLELLTQEILNLSGPDDSIRALLAATIIFEGDTVDQIASDEHPEWRTNKSPMIVEWPTNMEAVKEYVAVLRECWSHGEGIEGAHLWWREHQQELEEGFKVYWPARKPKKAINAYQSAINLWARDEAAFLTEMQGTPTSKKEETKDVTYATRDQIIQSTTTTDRFIIPALATKLAAFIDVQGECLIYSVVAGDNEFRRWVVDYGCFPVQSRETFWQRSNLTSKLSDHFASAQEGWLGGLMGLDQHLSSIEWQKEDGEDLSLGPSLVDAGYGESTDTVFAFCRQSSGRWLPSFGVGIGPTSLPLNNGAGSRAFAKKNRRWGYHWHQRYDSDRKCLYVRHDSNIYKTLVHSGILTPEINAGSLSLYAGKHPLVADHLRGEKPTKGTGHGREVQVWKLLPAKPDQDIFDCISGAGVALSMQGAAMPGTETMTGGRGKKKKSFGRRSLA